MGTHWRTRAKAVTLTISALLGLGALAGCTGSGGNSAVSTATKSVSKTAPSVGRATALLQGTLAAAARDVLYITDDSLLRPVLSEITNADGYTYQMSFSRWGETLPLTAPANTVPASFVTPVSSIT
jgi:hypothetical protein